MAIKDASELNFADADSAARAASLRKRIKAAGLSFAELRRLTGISRNVMYAISKGRAPKPEEQTRIDRVLSTQR